MKQIHKILLLLTLVFSTHVFGNDFDSLPKITLSGQGQIYKPADELQITIGVLELGDQAETVLAANSTKMQAIINGLEKIGLTKADYRTSQFNIHPTYTPYPKDPPQNWKPSINGYEVNNSIIIKTDKISLAGKIIDTAYKAGANNIENIHFALRDGRAYWQEAVSLATANAINDANVIAQAAGVKLGRILSITLNSTDTISPRVNNIYFAKASAESMPPIEGGDVSITANVSVVYEINEKP